MWTGVGGNRRDEEGGLGCSRSCGKRWGERGKTQKVEGEL